MSNTGMIRSFITERQLDNFVDATRDSGRVVFNDNGTIVKSFPLTTAERKLLDKTCSIADCQERWRRIATDVYVERTGTTVTITMKERGQ